MPPPNLVIYLKADPDFAYQRIVQRGRDVERGISRDVVVADAS